MRKPILSTTAHALLTEANSHPDRIARPPARLPVAAQRSVVLSLLKAGLLEEIPSENGQPAWRSTEAGEHLALRVTAAGLSAVGLEEAGPSTTVLPILAQPLASTAEIDAEGQGDAKPLAAGQDDPTTSSSADKRLSVRTDWGAMAVAELTSFATRALAFGSCYDAAPSRVPFDEDLNGNAGRLGNDTLQ